MDFVSKQFKKKPGWFFVCWMENKNRRITSVAGTTEKVPGLGSRKKAPPWQRESIRYTYKQKHLFAFLSPEQCAH